MSSRWRFNTAVWGVYAHPYDIIIGRMQISRLVFFPRDLHHTINTFDRYTQRTTLIYLLIKCVNCM